MRSEGSPGRAGEKKEKTEVKDNSIVNMLKLDHLGEVARKMQLC